MEWGAEKLPDRGFGGYRGITRQTGNKREGHSRKKLYLGMLLGEVPNSSV